VRRSQIGLVIGLLCLTARAAMAQPAFNVGSFAVPGTIAQGMPPPAVSQVAAHGLTQRPKALILWMENQLEPGLSFTIGVSDAPGSSYSFSAAAPDGETPSTASRRLATKALTVIDGNLTVVAEADLTSWDATNFALRWTPSRPATGVVHFIAIGGATVTAKVIRWEAPADPGPMALTGLGFMPSVVLHVYGGAAVGSDPPLNEDDALIGIGVMDRSGGQWANQIFSLAGSVPSTSLRMLATDACIYMFNNMGLTRRAAFGSMGRDGFTVDFDTTGQATNLKTQIVSLALGGVQAMAGRFDKSIAAAPASQPIAGLGFRPGVLLLSSVQDVRRLAPTAQSRFALGASDGTDQVSSAVSDANGVSPTVASAFDRQDRAFIKADSERGPAEAEATLGGFTSDGFSLTWAPNDRVATQIAYLALGPGTAPPPDAAVPDAPVPTDGGTPDAPSVDAAPDAPEEPPGPDAAGEAGTARAVGLRVGCACRTGGRSGPSGLWLLALALLARRRLRK
jgi:MYXO-CTERM domain-containing protein